MFWLVLIACGPKKPPADAVEMEREVPTAPLPMPTVAGNPLPYGTAHPFELAQTDAELALVRAEEIVLGMDRWPAAADAATSKMRAMNLVGESERALVELRLAASQHDLADIAACRTGDALRLAAAAVLETAPPVDGAVDPLLREAAQPLIDQATSAYSSVLHGADARWEGHARWGLGELEEL